MKNFLVRLQLQIGCYEKHTTQLIKADTVEQAEQAALVGETHNSTTELDEDGHWWDDDMIYTVDGCKELSDAEAQTYRNLIDLTTQN